METRNTVQKKMIINAVKNLQNHPTAEMIYDEVVRQHPTISKATVYRNLNQMAEQGMVLRVQIPNAADHYDFNTDKHYHLKCAVCGKVFDVNVPYMDELNHEQQGFVIKDHLVIFHGVCPDCNNGEGRLKEDENGSL